MARPLSKAVLLALVSEARDDNDGSGILAVSAEPHWTGDSVLETDEGVVRVVPCVSALAVRDVLTHRSEEKNGEVLVILTDRDEADLGQEVLARVWRRRLLRPSGWEAAKHLFRVDRLDPALADARWLVDLLVDVAPPRGYPPPPSGLLEIGTAWRTFLRHGLRIDEDSPTLEDLLRWGQTDPAREAVNGDPRRHLDRVAERLEEDAGPASSHVLRIVAKGRGDDLVPLGLVAGVLWGEVDSGAPEVLEARVRLEGPLDGKKLSAVAARAWGNAAAWIVRQGAESQGEATVADWLSQAQELLIELGAQDLTVVSDMLPEAFTQRLSQAGHALSKALDDPRDEQLQRVRAEELQVRRHLRAKREDEADRVRRLRMATRLVRRIVAGTGANDDASDLEAMASRFVHDGAWVDAAREALAHGETLSSLADAYDRLIEIIDPERAERDRSFATEFAAWSAVLPSDSKHLLPIERVLEEVVAPVARRAPVLLLVLDGLSYPDTTRLFSDLGEAGWKQQGPGGKELPWVTAALPTVTAVSRACLLTGRLAKEGGQRVERTGFEGHPELRDAAGGTAPKLFHQKDLKIDQGKIAPDVREAILDPSVPIVGTVVNAVDDHLDKGSQLRLAEGLHALRPLRPLLDAAAEAGRTVIIASDHGHVLESGSSVRVFPGAGERWRPADEPPAEDEVELAGPRVLRGDGKIVAPAVEKIRYMSAEKRGYHGGATPREVLCPLAVITPGNVVLEGWEHTPTRQPSWWRAESPVDVVTPLPRMRTPEPVVDPDGQGMLVTEEGEAIPATVELKGWIGELLDSPILAEQRQVAGRQALDDESIATFLAVLDRIGGVAPPAVLADATELPPSRIRTKLEALRRMLNVDGYPVVRIESDGTARLDREMLVTQFEVDL